MGAQAMVDYFRKYPIPPVIKLWNKTLCSVAAKQMLIYHKMSEAGSLYNAYYQQIAGLNYPSALRKVAVSNGSLNNLPNGYAEQNVLDIAIRTRLFVIPYLLNISIHNMTSQGPGVVFNLNRHIGLFIKIPITWTFNNNGNKGCIDAAPGCTYPTFDMLTDKISWMQYLGIISININQHSHCFMPITSVLDIKEPIPYATDVSNRDLVAEGKIPFDSYWGPLNKNMEHITFDNDLVDYLLNEIETYIQGPRDIHLCTHPTYALHLPQGTNATVTWLGSDNIQILPTNNPNVVNVAPLSEGDAVVSVVVSTLEHNDTLHCPIHVFYSSLLPEVEGTTIQGQSMVIDVETNLTTDTFCIENGKTMTITGTLHCAPGTRLVVRPGGRLVVDGGTLTGACAGEMWQGVQVLGNGGLSQNAANQGWLELKNGALIENARCAVQAEAGAVVKATNTAFRNNGRAVNFMPYVETMPGGSVRGNLSGFGNCTFTTDGDNLFAENGCEFTEHVRMSEVNGIEFHSCGFSDATAGGFTTHRGIYAQDAGFTLTKTCPSNIVFTGCVCAESYSRYNTFSGFNTAIEANTSGNQYAIEIDQTKFSGNGTAVRINGNNFVTVTRDTFDLTQSCSQPPFVTGLYLNNCSGYKVEGNHFKGLVMANVGSTTGVIVNNSGSADNTIYRNSFSSLNYGVQVRGDNGGADGGLQVACGSFGNVANPIYLTGGATMKSTDNVTINNCASTLCGITPGFPGHPFPVNAAGANQTNSAVADGHQALQTEVYYAAVRGIMADTVLDLGALQQWHTVAQPIADRYSLTETDFQMGLVDDVEGGDADYAQFHAMKAQLRDGRMVNWRDMTEAQKSELQEIAERNSGRASEMAKGVLCFYHGICLEDGDLSAEEPQGGTKSAKTAINNADNAVLYVYPNPTDGELNVGITDGAQIAAITLCDLQGRVVETQNFASLHGAFQHGVTTVITMQNIPAGAYILRVTGWDGKEYVRRVVKK